METLVSPPDVSSGPSFLFSKASGRRKPSKCLGSSTHQAGLGGYFPGFPSQPLLWVASPFLSSVQVLYDLGSTELPRSFKGFFPACFAITHILRPLHPGAQEAGKERGRRGRSSCPKTQRRNTWVAALTFWRGTACVQGCQTLLLAGGGGGGVLSAPAT